MSEFKTDILSMSLGSSCSSEDLSPSFISRILDEMKDSDTSLEIYRVCLPSESSPSEEKPPKHQPTPSVVVKNVQQSYQGILNCSFSSLQNSSELNRSISDCSFMNAKDLPPLPKKKTSGKTGQSEDLASTLLPNMSGDSTKMGETDRATQATVNSPRMEIEKSMDSSISDLHLVNWCKHCEKNTLSEVNFELKKLDLLQSIQYFFSAIKCCGSSKRLNRYHQAVQVCAKCLGVKSLNQCFSQS
mmetsp:Transcript_14466/g.21106  ORF Transcript_14466/g.21106 Transcript_14466/m.21106 type:complete len:244 (+) Transcript_14466:3090-3821(+)